MAVWIKDDMRNLNGSRPSQDFHWLAATIPLLHSLLCIAVDPLLWAMWRHNEEINRENYHSLNQSLQSGM